MNRIPRISPKTRARREAAGETYIASTIPRDPSAKGTTRKAKPKKRNPKRAKASHERAYGEYAKWIRSLPCVACGVVGHSEAAHTASGGKGRKADASTLAPLCGPHSARVYCLWDGIGKALLIEGCHRQSHRIGIQTFEAKYHVDLKAIAAQLWADYSRVSGGGREGR